MLKIEVAGGILQEWYSGAVTLRRRRTHGEDRGLPSRARLP